MADKSKIEWVNAEGFGGATWNPTVGCRRVSEGCRHCYAEKQAARIVAMERGRKRLSVYEGVVTMDDNGDPRPRWNGSCVPVHGRLDQPLRWTKPRLIFVNSMSDLFHEDISFDYIAAVFGVMGTSTKHIFQILTKRPKRMLEFFEWVKANSAGIRPTMLGHYMAKAGLSRFGTPQIEWPLPNVWLGVSVEDQAAADERIPLLLQCPAAVRWLSVEPIIGEVDLRVLETEDVDGEVIMSAFRWNDDEEGIDWVVVGGESGSDARECRVRWVESIVVQCQDADVPVFVKQLGTRPTCSGATVWPFHWPIGTKRVAHNGRFDVKLTGKGEDMSEWPEGLRVREWPKVMQTSAGAS